MARMTFELGKHKTLAKKHTNFTGTITPRRVKLEEVANRDPSHEDKNSIMCRMLSDSINRRISQYGL